MEKEFDIFINKVKYYNSEEVDIVTKAYEFAKKHHEGQYRQSGEPYIIHPLIVASILADMHADRDTLCAGLLHDVIEDCGVSKEEIENLFNKKIADLVDGVTNLSKMDIKNKEARDYGTRRKIIEGISRDVRIVIIKLADRLHNMNTLMYQSPDKQKEKAYETLTFYVPLARYIGAENIRRDLEDLSFMYLDKDEYYRILELVNDYVDKKKEYFHQMTKEINNALTNESISSSIRLRIKNIYSVYSRLNMGEYLGNLHDLIAIKVLVNNVRDCYSSLGVIHRLYKPFHSRFKDYIALPKANMYRSLHTTINGKDDTLVQAQIRTRDMENINTHGLTAYWDIAKGEAGNRMLEIIKGKYKYDENIEMMKKLFMSDEKFVLNVQKRILGEKINVRTYDGYIISLEEGSTVIDLAYRYGQEYAEHMIGAFVNGVPVSVDTILNDGDRVHILVSSDSLGISSQWLRGTVQEETQKAIQKGLRREKH